jgi:hypothetical protein
MHTFNFTLLAAVLSYVAVIGATPLRARAPAEAVDRRQLYVVLQLQLESPDCNQDAYDPLCRPCEIDPDQTYCVDVCKAYPDLSFCGPSTSGSADRRQLYVVQQL